MKQICKISLESIALLCASTLLFSLIFSLLYYFNLISVTLYHNANWICGVLCFGAGGLLLGMLAQKKALLHAFVIAAILLCLSLFLSSSFELSVLLKSGSKILAYVVCCLFAYTKLKKA